MSSFRGPLYNADSKALRLLQRMEYISLIEPRQQGKTSLINRLVGMVQNQDWAIAYADLTTLEKSSESTWYQSLSEWLLRQVTDATRTIASRLPTNGNSWRNFITDLATAAQKSGRRMAIALDEAGGVPKEWATDFFTAIRSAYNARQSMPCFRHLTFVIAGAYNPKILINNHAISNFNIDHRVHLTDFSLAETAQLVAHLQLNADSDFGEVLRRIQYWSGGQPFIVQKICTLIDETGDLITKSSVDAAVDQLFLQDTSHLGRISSDLDSNPRLLKRLSKLISDRTLLTPSINDDHFTLMHVIGIIAPDKSRHCRFRNHLYRRAFTPLLEDKAEDILSDETENTDRLPSEIRQSDSDVFRLCDVLVRFFSLGELESLSFELGIDFETIPGENKDKKARELVLYCQRHGRYAELQRASMHQRPSAFTSQ